MFVVLVLLNQYKVWVKPSSEMSYLYGNNIPKSGLGRMTDDTPQYAGVVVYNMSDVPLGFGIAAQVRKKEREEEDIKGGRGEGGLRRRRP